MVFREGEYVRHGSQPDWGIGRVLSLGENGKLTVFFLRGGKRILSGSTLQLEPAENPHHRVLELAGTARDPNRRATRFDPSESVRTGPSAPPVV